jgi:acetoin utilization protein AcuC
MNRRSRVVWDDDFVRYDFGDGHPMAPLRIDLTARLCRDLGLFEHVDVVDAAVADDDLLRTVHSAGLVAAVRAASVDPGVVVGHGIGTDDTPPSPVCTTPRHGCSAARSTWPGPSLRARSTTA